MPLPLRRTGEIASCKGGAVRLQFLFCAGFGAHQSKPVGGPVYAGLVATSLRSLTVE
jgi:hypothetical protein